MGVQCFIQGLGTLDFPNNLIYLCASTSVNACDGGGGGGGGDVGNPIPLERDLIRYTFSEYWAFDCFSRETGTMYVV